MKNKIIFRFVILRWESFDKGDKCERHQEISKILH